MLSSSIRLALRQRLLALLAALGIAAWGLVAYTRLPIDAFPDVSPTQVVVVVRAPGLTPEELEARGTAPVELAMKGIPNLVQMRSTTRYAVSLMTFDFAEGTDVYWARVQVSERLREVQDQLPDGASGGLAPVVTPLSEMLVFTVEGGGLDPMARRHLVDWTLRPALRDVPGVADVNSIGGFVRTFEVAPDPAAMAARRITLGRLQQAIEANNRNDGAGRVARGEEALLVSAEARIRSAEDVRDIVLAAHPGGGVVRVGDVAEVRTGTLARNGVVTSDGEGESVWAIVLGLRGVNAQTLVAGVKGRLAELEKDLPEGVRVRVFYDRGELIGKAVWTVQKVLLEAVALVVVLLVLFLGSLRSALVVSLTLPLAVLTTFGAMRLYGLSANIMSLGGLAIAIGLLVDCAVVVVENTAHRYAAQPAPPGLRDRLRLAAEAAEEVAVPLVSGVVIIVTVFLPLLSLQGLEGRMFAPVALTIAFALCAALLLSLLLVPTLCAYVLRGGAALDAHGHPRDPWLVRRLHAAYDPFLAWSMRKPLRIAAAVAGGVAFAVWAFLRIGSTFMPVMDEGTTILTVRKHLTVSVAETAEIDMKVQRMVLERVPEVRGIMARAGADEIGLDPMGLGETDMWLTFAPRGTWRRPDRAWLLREIGSVVEELPGISISFSQPIDMRVQEMIIGARGDVVLKVFGPDLGELNRIAAEAAAAIGAVPGATEVYALRNEGMKYLSVAVDRRAAGRFGLDAEEVQRALRVWVDGQQVGIVLEGEVRTPLVIRGEEAARRSASDLARVPIVLPGGGGSVPLSQVAEIREVEGPFQVVREQGRRFSTVLANVRGRDLVGFVGEAQAAVAQRVQAPQGYRLVWGGQFENQQRASARLAIVVPVALALIFLLLYLTFGSVRQSVLVFCNVPFAVIGGVVGLWLSGEFLSVPASVGFIALIGIAVLNGVVLVSHINRLSEEGHPLRMAVMEGAKRRMTPVALTACIAAFGLVPFLFAEGPGSEIQRPLAVVVIGGLVSATVLTLVLLPILYDRFAVPGARAARPQLEHDQRAAKAAE